MNVSLPMFPIYLVDIAGSTLSLGVAIACVVYSRRLYRTDTTHSLWTYLFWISAAFAAFTVFRSVGHILKYILIVSGHKALWAHLSPISGAVISLIFVFVAALTFYHYERVKQNYQVIEKERDYIKASEEKLEKAHDEVQNLIDQVRRGKDLSVRYYNPDLIKCWEFKDCALEECSAYLSQNLRCWHIERTHCCRDKNGAPGGCKCEGCPIYMTSQQDPLSRIGERFNDMMQMLETKTRELEEANLHLKEMDVRKSKFLDIVAHDLRTPLTSILSYADLLLRYKSESEETKDEFLRIITYESRRLGDLINDYLDLSKIEAGLFECRRDQLNFKDVIDHTVSVYSGTAIQKGIDLHMEDVPQELNLIGDKKRLQQVMSNLLSNAAKFTPQNGEVVIRAGLEDQGRELHVTVSDTGPGIPETHIQKIFNKFTQVGQEEMHTVGGSGLGLSICKEVVEFHAGRIWAENLKEGGVCFHLTLPVKALSPDAIGEEVASMAEKRVDRPKVS